MDHPTERRLVESALAATTQSFLTSPGGCRYGAAVLTVGGRTFSSGQYSSWNHTTNIHAEMGAILVATMAGEPDIVALAVASTREGGPTRPCGVCRQVMKEHSDRTGRDFTVLMSAPDGTYERSTVGELLPMSWSAASRASGGTSQFALDDRRFGIPESRRTAVHGIRCGDHVVCGDGAVAMVWDPVLEPDVVLAKIKYAAADRDGGRHKVAHAFTQPSAYEAELARIGWYRVPSFGGVAAVLGPADIRQTLPAIPAGEFDDAGFAAVLRLLGRAGITPESAAVTGSRSIGFSRSSSDWDVVVHATPAEAAALREVLAAALRDGSLLVPDQSRTWQTLSAVFPGGRATLIEQRRFAETFSLAGRTVALMLTRSGSPTPCIDPRWTPAGLRSLSGTVVEASQAPFKRAIFTLRHGDGATVDVISYHKTANLVRPGDRLAVRGWEVTDGSRSRLVQLSSSREGIVWLTS